jgi:hypothetical protein
MIYRKLRLLTPFSGLIRQKFLCFPFKPFKSGAFFFSDKNSKKPNDRTEEERPKEEEKKEDNREKQEEEAHPKFFDFKKELINFFKDKNLKFFGIDPNWFNGNRKYYLGLGLALICLTMGLKNFLEPDLLTFNVIFVSSH